MADTMVKPPQLFSIEKMLNQIPQPQQPPVRERYVALRTHLLTKYETELRDDSRLGWAYIVNPNLLMNIDDIAKEIWYMKLLYMYSDYPQSCKELLPNIKYKLVQGNEWYPYSSQRAWEHIQNYVIPILKMEHMVRLMDKGQMPCENISSLNK
jgi:hypothetical protein